MLNLIKNTKWKYRKALVCVMVVTTVLATSILGVFMHRTGARADSANWTTFLGSNARTGFNASETAINPSTAPNLALAWQYKSAGSVTTQPIIMNGMVYWGSWDGHEYASSLSDGSVVWSTFLGTTQDSICVPPAAGVASTATVTTVTINGQNTLVDFVAGGDANFYALDANTGALLWKTPLGTSPDFFIWSSPAVYNGDVYVGISSFGDCPLIQGGIVQMDAATGTILHTFHTVPDGCRGASVWGSPAIDEQAGMIYFATGNKGKCSVHENLAYSLLELNAADLSFVNSWKVSQLKGDNDFGSTPTLFTAKIKGTLHYMVGLLNKNGTYYAFDRSNIGAGPLWQDTIGQASDQGAGAEISSSAWDGTTLYIVGDKTTINGVTCGSSVKAVNPADGTYLWQACLNGFAQAPLMAVPGVLVIGAGITMYVLNPADGSLLYSFHQTHTHAKFQSAATISNGVLYIGNNNGCLYAFTPQ